MSGDEETDPRVEALCRAFYDDWNDDERKDMAAVLVDVDAVDPLRKELARRLIEQPSPEAIVADSLDSRLVRTLKVLDELIDEVASVATTHEVERTPAHRAARALLEEFSTEGGS